jgi:hypothetical protein
MYESRRNDVRFIFRAEIGSVVVAEHRDQNGAAADVQHHMLWVSPLGGGLLSAEKLYAPAARQGSLVAHFLCCQSIELSLKGFLSLKGLKRTELRKRFGHTW